MNKQPHRVHEAFCSRKKSSVFDDNYFCRHLFRSRDVNNKKSNMFANEDLKHLSALPECKCKHW